MCYCKKQAHWADHCPWPFYIRPLLSFHIASNLISEAIKYILSCHSPDKAMFPDPQSHSLLDRLMFQSKRFFLCAGLKRYFIQNWTNNTSCLYPPGLFLHNLQNSDLRFYSNTRGVTDTMAHADELNFINVLFVDLHTHLTFGSICLRISQAMLSNCRYGDNRLSTKTGKSCDYGIWTWSGNALQQATML